MELLTSIGPKVIKTSFLFAKRHAGYFFHYKTKVENYGSKANKLALLKTDVQGRVQSARDSGEVIHSKVEVWITNVEEIEAIAQTLDDEVKEDRKCFMGWCPDCISNYRLGKDAATKIEDIDKLIDEGEKFSSVSNFPLRPTIASWPTESNESFLSRDSEREKIIKALKDEISIIIGVYGMAGVGKTTLMMEIGKKMEQENVYDEVVMVILPEGTEVKEIQQLIGEQLGLPLTENNESMRASRLTERLKRVNRVLIILVNVWNTLELAKLGIPSGDEHRGCKIVLTTSRKDVCDQMRCHESIEIDLLSKNESWELFAKNAGNAVNSPGIKRIAEEIVGECGGLTVALVTLGKALQGANKAVWKDTLVKLRKANPEDIEGMNGKVFSSLKLSFKLLDNESIKSFFLLCCLFPKDEDIDKEVLMAYGMGMGLLDSVDSLEQARTRVHNWTEILKARCLLLDSSRKGCVKMHNVVRDAAISIAKRDHGFLVHARVGREEWPEGDLGKIKKISLILNKIVALPNQSGCPKLQMLLLQDSYYLKNIGENFFQEMKALKVLDLSTVSIISLPHSMQHLMNIKTLRLENFSQLKDISLIGGLTKLEILSLRGSGIAELPEKIAQLTRLKLLDLTNTEDLKKIPPNVISKLSRLEELYMHKSFCQWEVYEESDSINAGLWEVASLKRLTILHIWVQNLECVSQEIIGPQGIIEPWRGLKKFNMNVGTTRISTNDANYDRNMALENVPNTFPNWVKMLLERTQGLMINRCNSIPGLPVRLNSLKRFDIGRCEGMKHLIVAKELIRPSALENLEVLQIEHMENLETFYDGPLPSGFLKKLRVLSVHYCGRPRFVFSSALVQNLQQLEKLVLNRCGELEKIISEEEKEHHEMEKKAEEAAIVKEEKSLSSNIVEMRNPHTFQNLKFLEIYGCSRLKYVMSLQLAQGLPKLEELNVYHCVEMTDIIFAEKETWGDHSILPQLRSIWLKRLRNLKSLCSRRNNAGVFLNWPILSSLQIYGCPRLKRLCIGPDSAPNLKKITGSKEWFKGLEEVKEERSIVSQRLRLLFSRAISEIDEPDDEEDELDELGKVD